VRLRAEGPAARAGVRLGERVVAVGGRAVGSAKEAEASLAAASIEGSLELTLEGGTAGTRRVRVDAAVTPLLLPPPAGTAEAALRAAWGAAESAARPDDPAPAADLAIALAAAGQVEAAIERWGGRRWTRRAGIGEGTAAYFLGRALQAAGKDREAAQALARAVASQGTAESDDGPAVGPAAASRP
jgi:hypothetical protein